MSGEYDELVKRLRAGHFDTESIANEAADAIRALETERDKQKLRGDNHWETLRSIREFARQGDCERIILWVNDAGSGYTQPSSATMGQLIDDREEWKSRAESAEKELTDARKSLAWISQLYPSATADGYGAIMEVVWDEWNALRRFVGLTEQKPSQQKQAAVDREWLMELEAERDALKHRTKRLETELVAELVNVKNAETWWKEAEAERDEWKARAQKAEREEEIHAALDQFSIPCSIDGEALSVSERIELLSDRAIAAEQRLKAAEDELRSKDPNYTPLLDKYTSDIQAYADRAEAAEQSRDALAKAIKTILLDATPMIRSSDMRERCSVNAQAIDALRSLIEALDNG